MGSLRRLVLISGSVGTAAAAAYATITEGDSEFLKNDPWHDASRPPVTRKQQLTTLKTAGTFDILVIGGSFAC